MNGQAPELPGGTSPSPSDLSTLLDYFRIQDVSARAVRNSRELREYQERATRLFARDYHVSLIDNKEGQYCASYPLDIVVLEAERRQEGEGEGEEGEGDGTAVARVNEGSVLKEYFHRSRFSRAHGRFVIPVILYGRKNICRSGTLSHHMESLFNNVHAKTREMLSTFPAWPWGGSGSSTAAAAATATGSDAAPLTPEQKATELTLGAEAHRNADEALLLLLHTRYICDLMVEKRKKMLGMSITSSEKAELERYAKFTISSIPYPGCEFFKFYKDQGHCGIDLFYDWTDSIVNAELSLGFPASSSQAAELALDPSLMTAVFKRQQHDRKLAAALKEEEEAGAEEKREAAAAGQQKKKEEAGELLESQGYETLAPNARIVAPASSAAAAASSAAAAAAIASSAAALSSTSSLALPLPPPPASASASSAPSPSPPSAPSPTASADTKTADGEPTLTSSSSAPSLTSLPASLQGETSVNGSRGTAEEAEAAAEGQDGHPGTASPAPLLSPSGAAAAVAPQHQDMEEEEEEERKTKAAASIKRLNGACCDAAALSSANSLQHGWADYKTWDVVRLTRNYMWLILSHIADPTTERGGLLVHCVSGWDRTPHFVSLIRLSLWADGAIHNSLDAAEMLYLTLAYDWMLFGHRLSTRLGKGEDLIHFTFDFLQYFTEDTFSIFRISRRRIQAALSTGRISKAVADDLLSKLEQRQRAKKTRKQRQEPKLTAAGDSHEEAKAVCDATSVVPAIASSTLSAPASSPSALSVEQSISPPAPAVAVEGTAAALHSPLPVNGGPGRNRLPSYDVLPELGEVCPSELPVSAEPPAATATEPGSSLEENGGQGHHQNHLSSSLLSVELSSSASSAAPPRLPSSFPSSSSLPPQESEQNGASVPSSLSSTPSSLDAVATGPAAAVTSQQQHRQQQQQSRLGWSSCSSSPGTYDPERLVELLGPDAIHALAPAFPSSASASASSVATGAANGATDGRHSGGGSSRGSPNGWEEEEAGEEGEEAEGDAAGTASPSARSRPVSIPKSGTTGSALSALLLAQRQAGNSGRPTRRHSSGDISSFPPTPVSPVPGSSAASGLPPLSPPLGPSSQKQQQHRQSWKAAAAAAGGTPSSTTAATPSSAATTPPTGSNGSGSGESGSSVSRTRSLSWTLLGVGSLETRDDAATAFLLSSSSSLSSSLPRGDREEAALGSAAAAANGGVMSFSAASSSSSSPLTVLPLSDSPPSFTTSIAQRQGTTATSPPLWPRPALRSPPPAAVSPPPHPAAPPSSSPSTSPSVAAASPTLQSAEEKKKSEGEASQHTSAAAPDAKAAVDTEGSPSTRAQCDGCGTGTTAVMSRRERRLLEVRALFLCAWHSAISKDPAGQARAEEELRALRAAMGATAAASSTASSPTVPFVASPSASASTALTASPVSSSSTASRTSSSSSLAESALSWLAGWKG